MTDKVQKIREEVERLRKSYQIMYQELDCESPELISVCAKRNLCQDILMFIDSLQEEPVSEELGEYINELSKQFPEVSFAKLSRIAVRVANWHKEQFEKNRLKHCNSITNEQAGLESDFIDQHLDKYQRMPTFLDAIEYGMKLKEQQMMAKAVDGVARPYDNEIWCILDSFNLKDGDKVKVIVIKED